MLPAAFVKGSIERPLSEEYRLAERVVWKMLTNTSMQKITRGHDLVEGVAVGNLGDLPENEGNDVETGTFAGLLRYGRVWFEQTREEIGYVNPEVSEKGLRKGLLEP